MTDWHQRYLQQAEWTKQLRDHLFSRLSLASSSQVLEVGCGTGAVLSDFTQSCTSAVFGIDINFSSLQVAKGNSHDLPLAQADARTLPFAAKQFDIVFCHYFFLWIKDPKIAMQEIKRILKPGGDFLIFAEPDYEGRIDSPESLTSLGKLQTQSLLEQGANPFTGRQISSWLAASGFTDIRVGISGCEQSTGQIPAWWDSEWQILENDLGDTLAKSELVGLKELDRAAWISGERVLWVPTFYAHAKKPV